ncbi:MAG: deaminase [Candidatus Eisenbacteria bacterium]
MSKPRRPASPAKRSEERGAPSAPRPTFPEIYMKMAFQLARRSTCRRLQVGTVIASADYRRILAVGYNGNATGLPNACDRDDAGNCGCLHSEENAVINCTEPRETRKIVLVTHLPCVMCAKRLINLGGVERVYYAREYRNIESTEILERSGIEVVSLTVEE